MAKAKQKPKISKREFDVARAFLKTLGGNLQNTYLILAVVAWQRAMAKAHDKYWASLRGYSGTSAGAKLAAHIKAKAGAGKYAGEYKALIMRLRQQLGGTTKAAGAAQAKQAKDFISSIEKSHYDPKHYGKVEYVEGHYTSQYVFGQPVTTWVPTVMPKDPLFDAWAALTNSPNIPDSWWVHTTKTITKTVKTTPPRPHQPRSLMHVKPAPDYIQPLAAYAFYQARPHYGDNVLLDD